MTFGKVIPNLEIDGKPANYGVVNERDTRAGAGIMLVVGICAFTTAFFLQSYLLLSIVVLAFTLEFIIRVIDPHYAPFYALGAFIVRKQRPEWSGAIQKRFAWSLGLTMALSMILIAIIFNIRGPLPFTICGICLTLLWLESAFGICVGCKLYYGFLNLGWIKPPETMPSCPGGVCPIKKP
jgi:hypothetical protein